MMDRLPSFDVFGYKITPATLNEQLSLLSRCIAAREQCVIANLNVHGLHTLQHEPAMRQLHRRATTYVGIDGMPLVWLCKLAGVAATQRHRVTYVDLIWPLLSLAERSGWRVYYIGGTQEVAQKALHAIRRRLPSLEVAVHHGYIDIGCDSVIAEIRQFRPDFVIVGMGMPLQERWILEHSHAIEPACLLAGGAIMEYVAGVVNTPPRWMGPLGLEWFYRLAENPRRFWRRYLIEPWVVAWILLRQVARARSGLIG
jgi:N-acetylglucosaminyldiphosphoundecaprenol N-acetyl-beta-D-mannosaminyltransferase